jgi:RHS repeat-associated protein
MTGSSYLWLCGFSQSRENLNPRLIGDRSLHTVYQRDQESGLDYAMNRFESNVAGRFLSVDKAQPVFYVSAMLNRYTYGSNDPLNGTDPDGNIICTICTPPPNAEELCRAGGGTMQNGICNINTLGPGNGGGLPQGGQQSGGSPAPLRDWELMPAARTMAMNLLSDPACQKLFGYKTNARGFGYAGVDPRAVLDSLIKGGKYGNIQFEPFIESTWNASTASGNTFNTVTIRINNGATGEWNKGNAEYNALTLLHELAHAFNDIIGLPKFSLNNDAEKSDPNVYDKLLKQDCFKGKLK